MKITLAVFFLLCASAAFAQSAPVLSNEPQFTTFQDHPQRAEPHGLASEQFIVGGSSDAYSYAQGQEPLWQFGPVSQPVPLGDIARACRKEKESVKKAGVVLEKQGS